MCSWRLIVLPGLRSMAEGISHERDAQGAELYRAAAPPRRRLEMNEERKRSRGDEGAGSLEWTTRWKDAAQCIPSV